MLKAIVNGQTYRFTFAHPIVRMEDPLSKPRTDPDTGQPIVDLVTRRLTVCAIERPDGKVFKGEALTHPLDRFEKDKGRKIALARALSELGLAPMHRAIFWDAYFDRLLPAEAKK